ncbi:lysozyme inhibitor LprI family protein, partial [Salmonella enterica subsp. enterica serovar Infantis]
QSAIKRAQPPQRELLQKAQVAWIALRDADCALIRSGTEGGSGQLKSPSSHCSSEAKNASRSFVLSVRHWLAIMGCT